MSNRNIAFCIKPSALIVMSALTTLSPALPSYANQAEINPVGKAGKSIIPYQPLANALLAFSKVTGLQVSADASLLTDKMSNPVITNLSHDVMLTTILKGSGLDFKIINNSTVLIVPSTFSTSEPMETIVVTKSAETAYGPVDGYHATQSATGTKTDTALRDIPQSIQVVPRQVLNDQQAKNLSDALKNVSAVQVSGTAGNRTETFNVRGFSSPSYAIDGVMLNSISGRPANFIDMVGVERVEVLKGPASALYGRGEPGGLINIITRQPTYDFKGDAQIQAGSFGFWRGESTMSGPLNNDRTLTGRISGALQTEDGFQQHRSRSERQTGNLMLKWEPTLYTRVNFSHYQNHQEMPFDRGLVVSDDNRIHLSAKRYLGEEWSSIDSRNTSTAVDIEHEVSETLALRSTLRYEKAYTHDTGIDYRSLYSDGRTLQRRYTDRIERSQNLDAQFSTLIDASTSAIDHKLLSGMQYTNSRLVFNSARAKIASIDIFDPVYGANLPIPTPNSDFTQRIRVGSLFIQDQINFSSQWKALVGLRYDHVWQETDQRIGNATPKINDGALTGRAGVVYQPSVPISIYANYADSFTPQSGQQRNGKALEPEKGWQIESGIKWDLLPDALSLTTAVFQITKFNVKAADPNDTDYSITTGKQRVRGIEMDLVGKITPGWNIIASAAWLDALITRDEHYAVGNKLPSVPAWSSSLWTTYEIKSGRLSGLKLGSGIQAVGARKGDLENGYVVGGFYSLDTMIAYQVSPNLSLSLHGKNLTNQNYIATPVSRMENYPGAPRSVLGSLKVTF
ncbi:TonB-dependent siderophore receptor [Rosenbergiella australiborealis]|uniref:TonB-dependent siderophore receptor n=1 Tax=Rosenbergiella australiborealis TaxID=1544696 RepID=UPI001F4E3540|nr:TonB-dependent siderophore receptor [Rosenbergiella australiborealis]